MNWFDNAPVTQLGGMTIMALSRYEFAHGLLEDYASRGPDVLPRLSTSANGNVLALYGRDQVFRDMVDQMDIVDADGMSLVFLSRLFGQSRLPERVATTDFFHDAASVAERSGLSFYFLGATPSENKAAVDRVRSLYPRLRISGQHHGYFDEDDEADLCKDIVSVGTDVLWVGLGVPKEQKFMLRNRERLIGLTWVKSGGGLFNFLSETMPRAPVFMQNIGLEWAFRMVLEPKRLGPRYLTTNFEAIYRVVTATQSSTSTSPAKSL